MKSTTKQLLAVMALVALPLSAFAAPLTGSILIGGAATPTCSGGGSCDMSNADGLSFLNGGAISVTLASGSFAADGLGFGSTGSINDFDFNPLNPNPVSPLWTISGNVHTFTFDLEQITFLDQSLQFLDLLGTGTVYRDGMDATAGTWSLSADCSGASCNVLEFAFSSTVAIPEPGILMLLGAGLLGLGLGRRKA